MFKIKIADLNIEIENIYKAVEKYCEGYFTKEERTDVKIISTPEKIEKEKAQTNEDLPLPMYELTSIYREICAKILNYNCLLIHASSISFDNEAYLFLAVSGTGKSTHARMWKETYKEHVTYINDDKPILRLIDGVWMVCGTPWNGKHRLGENKMVPLKALCLLERSEENYTHKITSKEVLNKLFNQIIIPKNIDMLDITFHLLNDLLSKIGLYKIGCNISKEAAITAYEAIKKSS